jgi:hypothetical protein
MKNITYDLIEKLESLQDHEAAEEEILSQTEDSLYYCTLSSDRVNILDSFPWDKSMQVLQLGACNLHRGGRAISGPRGACKVCVEGKLRRVAPSSSHARGVWGSAG